MNVKITLDVKESFGNIDEDNIFVSEMSFLTFECKGEIYTCWFMQRDSSVDYEVSLAVVLRNKFSELGSIVDDREYLIAIARELILEGSCERVLNENAP